MENGAVMSSERRTPQRWGPTVEPVRAMLSPRAGTPRIDGDPTQTYILVFS